MNDRSSPWQIHFINSQFALYGFSVDIVQSLPEELGLKVMSFLDPKSLCHAAQACRTWRRLAGDPRVWRDLVDQECYWRISSDEWNQMEDKVAAGEHALWKTYFSHHYRIKRNWMTGRFAVRTFEGHKSHVSCVQFDDSRIVSGSSDKTIRYGGSLFFFFFFLYGSCLKHFSTLKNLGHPIKHTVQENASRTRGYGAVPTI